MRHVSFVWLQEILYRIVQSDDKLAALPGPELSKISTGTTTGIREAYEMMYKGYTPTVEIRSDGTLSQVCYGV